MTFALILAASLGLGLLIFYALDYALDAKEARKRRELKIWDAEIEYYARRSDLTDAIIILSTSTPTLQNVGPLHQKVAAAAIDAEVAKSRLYEATRA